MRSPTASRLIFDAADKYPSSNAEDMPRELTMLSKPKLESSAGKSEVTSTSTASRSRMALAYSLRFRRWRPGELR